MTFENWFNKQSILVKIILLLIPGVNWIVELLVRWSSVLRTKNIVYVLIAIFITSMPLSFVYAFWKIVVIIIGGILYLIDLLWVVLFNHMFLAK